MAPGTFNDLLDPGNSMPTSANGNQATMNSLADIAEAVSNGVLTAAASADSDVLLSVTVGGKQVSLELDGIGFAALTLLLAQPDPSPTDDTLTGTGADDTMFGHGGDDGFLLRCGSDTATGGTGADRFTVDGRYVNPGDAHRITDLNFAEGDFLDFRFMDVGTFDDSVDPGNFMLVQNGGAKATIDSAADLLEAHANGVLTGADDGFGGTVLSVSVAGKPLTLTLDGLDIF
jgi:Ca2+-binding RTX toxin-like protein